MARNSTADLALSPYRVLDLSDEKGVLCGKMLADFGADVIKVERPGGDPSRNIGPFYDDVPHSEKSLFWFAYNANKRGITLNIETSDGRDLLKSLVKTADFVIESFAPGYLDSLGLGYSALSQVNPRIILTSITPFGQTGPKAGHKACDLTAWASGNALYISGDPDRPPNWISYPQAFLHAGAEAATASLIAHWHREANGEGQHVDVSAQECAIWVTTNTTVFWDLSHYDYARSGIYLVDTYTAASSADYSSLAKMAGSLFTCLAGEHLFLSIRPGPWCSGWTRKEWPLTGSRNSTGSMNTMLAS